MHILTPAPRPGRMRVLTLFGLEIWVIFCRKGPRGNERLILCQGRGRSRQSGLRSMFVSLGRAVGHRGCCYEAQTFISGQIPAEGGGRGSSSCCVRAHWLRTQTPPHGSARPCIVGGPGPCTSEGAAGKSRDPPEVLSGDPALSGLLSLLGKELPLSVRDAETPCLSRVGGRQADNSFGAEWVNAVNTVLSLQSASLWQREEFNV